MKLREANTHDIPRLLELEQKVIEAERPFDASLKSSKTHYYDLPELINSPNCCLVVAEDSGEIVATGYARIRESKEAHVHDRHSYLGFMYVTPEQRGKGVNQIIVKHLVEWSQSKGIKDLYLEVYHQNDPAVRAYQKAGFEPCLLEMKLCL